jgi:hypothetical protein
MTRLLIISGMVALMGAAALGQDSRAKSDGPTGTAGTRGSSEAAADSKALNAGTLLEAELQSVLDVRKNKVGDEVTLKATKAIKQDGQVIVPKGSQLIGRVTEIQRKTKENASSKIALLIDRVRGEGIDTPVTATIVSVTAHAGAAAGDLFAADAGATGTTSTSNRGGGGGGLLSGVGSTLGSAVGTATSTVSQTVGTATNVADSTTGTLGSTVRGLQITNSTSLDSSSAISAQGRDVRIEKGTTFRLRVENHPSN